MKINNKQINDHTKVWRQISKQALKLADNNLMIDNIENSKIIKLSTECDEIANLFENATHPIQGYRSSKAEILQVIKRIETTLKSLNGNFDFIILINKTLLASGVILHKIN